jgi:uncharacterized alkaline shock family protein YloU
MDELQGKVTIAPTVLTTIVRQTAREESGVVRLAPLPAKVRGLRSGGAIEEGVLVAVTEQGVQVEVHVVVDPQCNMLKVGTALQASITRAIQEMVGMQVVSVDVFIDEVAVEAAKAG